MDSQERDLEAFKAQLQKEVEQYKAQIMQQFEAWKLERETVHISLRGALEFANNAIKLLVLANGGAVIVSLPALSTLASSSDATMGHLVSTLAPSIKFFGGGVAAALLAATSAYLAQVCFTELATLKRKI